MPAEQPTNDLVTFRLQVSDGSQTTRQDYTVRVIPQNLAPEITPIADRTVTAGATFRLDVWATDANGDALTYTLDAASVARGLTIDHFGRIRWTTDASDITATPPPTVTVTVSDGRLSASETFALSVVADTTGPTVTIVPESNSAGIGDQLSIVVHAIDDVAVASKTLTLQSVTRDGQPMPLNQSLTLDNAGFARLTLDASHLGTLLFAATATDSSGNVGTAAPVTVDVYNPADDRPPSATITAPNAQAVVSEPIDVLGTVAEFPGDSTEGLRWELWSIPLDGGKSELLADGPGAVANQLLGRFDPTRLANGLYQLELRATDSGGNTAVDSVTVEVEGNLKLGNFTLTFQDLELPLAGLPITITRTYDTLQASKEGDFGYRWRLDLAGVKVNVVQPGNTSGVPDPFRDGDRIVFTLPDGSKHGFTFVDRPVNPRAPFADPQSLPEYRPDPGRTRQTNTNATSGFQSSLLRMIGDVASGHRALAVVPLWHRDDVGPVHGREDQSGAARPTDRQGHQGALWQVVRPTARQWFGRHPRALLFADRPLGLR